jgi:uncharacterized membrane protein YbhN (UPF0104 family)
VSSIGAGATPVSAAGSSPDFSPDEMPMEMHRLRRRLLQIGALLVVVVVVVMLVPGLGDVRKRLESASPGWLAVAAGLEVLSCLAYVVVFRAAFCARMTWRMSYRIGMSELGAASVLPAGGAGGLALGAWALRRSGLPLERVARRTVAFFLITSAVNFAAVILVGVALALGLLPGTGRLLLTVGPVVLAVGAILLTLAAPRLTHRLAPGWSAPGRARRLRTLARALDATGDGIGEAGALLRAGNAPLLGGAIGYLAFDVAVLAGCFRAFGVPPPIAGLLLAYLVGQLGSLIPVPGGIGGAEIGLVGALVLYGTPAAVAAAAVLAYRTVLLVVPAVLGGWAFLQLKRSLRDEAAARIPCADDLPAQTVARAV